MYVNIYLVYIGIDYFLYFGYYIIIKNRKLPVYFKSRTCLTKEIPPVDLDYY